MRKNILRGSLILSLALLVLLGLSGNVMAQDEEEAFLFGLGIAILAICAIIMLIIAILVGIWMYRDANSRGMSGIMWLLY